MKKNKFLKLGKFHGKQFCNLLLLWGVCGVITGCSRSFSAPNKDAEMDNRDGHPHHYIPLLVKGCKKCLLILHYIMIFLSYIFTSGSLTQQLLNSIAIDIEEIQIIMLYSCAEEWKHLVKW